MPYSMEKHEMEMEMERKRKREVQRLHDLPTQLSSLFIEDTCMSSACNSELYSAFKVMIS